MTTLHLYGSPRLRFDGGRELPLSPREAALLAWLHGEGRTPRAKLAAMLWPHSGEAQARANLRQTLARLKRAAGVLWAEDETGLALQVDVAPAGGEPLLGGVEFDDADELARWLAERRAALQRELHRAALAQLRALIGQGALDEALVVSNRLLAADPESEEGWRLRMELFYLRGDRAAALAAWDECRHQLRQAFGATPSEPTNALGRLILGGEAALPSSGPAKALPTALRRPPRLVGRDGLLREIERGLSLGHAAVLAGEGGIGKTRLLQELAARHPASLQLSARPGDQLVAGVLLGRLLAAALARWAPQLDAPTRDDLQVLLPGAGAAAGLQSAQEHRRVLNAAARALHACHRCGLRLVLLDDLQFADDASLAALQMLLGRWAQAPAGELPVPVIGLRPDEISASGRALLEQLAASGRAARFDLAPLRHAEVVALLQSMPLPGPSAPTPRHDELAAALLARVGGNPAHLVESLKGLWLDEIGAWSPGQRLPVPPTLVEAVRQRLQRLGDEPLQLAQLAAIAGADFSLQLAARLLDRTPLALAPLLARLENAQVFNGQGFAHDLVAEAVAASIPSALGAGLHALVADHLAARPDRHDAAARIAAHLQAAGQPRAAAQWLLRAAQQAKARWQMRDAALAFEAAARAIDAADRLSQRDSWLEAARCWILASRNDEAAAALAAAEQLSHGAAEQALLLPARTAWLFNCGRRAEAVSSAEAMIDAVAEHGEFFEPRELAHGIRTVAVTVSYGTDIDRALALADRAQALIGQRDAAAMRLLRTARGGLLHWASRPLQALADLQAARPAAGARHEAGTRIAVANQLMRVRHALGDLPGALTLGRQLLAEAETLELGITTIADVMHVLAMMEIGSGQAAAGMLRWQQLQQKLAAAGLPLAPLYQTAQALAAIAIGRHDDALGWLEQHPPLDSVDHPAQRLNWLLVRAWLADLQRDDPGRWLAAAADCGPLPPALLLQREVASALIRPPAYPALQPLLDLLRERGVRSQWRSAEIAAARAALLAGETELASGHARQALRLASAVECWIDEAASVWLTAAEVLRDCGAADEADAAAGQGAAWVERGAAQWADAAAREAWRHGNPVHHRLLAWHVRPAQAAVDPAIQTTAF
ncbi:ATP-binding protein [Piscinibacter sakaiensis]|uniref:ATP-binding protein n=1 Tax=Piscinibacter sakaiensis TaxID=1547922 RepID=UPI003AB0F712